jgi:twinkle protein
MTWAKTGQPCPCGKSSDAYAIDTNGNGFCFRGGCSKFFRAGKEEEPDKSKFLMKPYAHRGITEKTFAKFGVLVKWYEDKPFEVGFRYPNGSFKLRPVEYKSFRTQNGTEPGSEFKEAALYGKNVFDKSSKRVITITEGEYDALSVFQMIGEETAAVSVRGASSAKSDCRKDYEYLNSFDKIVINFDNDEPGQSAAKQVASLFDFKKVFNLILDKHKDANGYLKAGEIKEYFNAWKSVKRYTPDNILSTWSDFEEAIKKNKEQKIGDYPFEQLQSMLHGIHAGEVIVIKGDEGIGKTEIFRAMQNHFLKTTKIPLGIIHLEEDNGTTLRGIASYYAKDGSLHPDAMITDEEVLDNVKKATENDESRIFLHSSFDVEDETAFTDNVRFLVAGCGCKAIFLDHISWLATGGMGEDERLKLDRISQRLKLLAKELGFAMIEIAHVNDDGKTRGSRNITKVANTVIHLSRDKTNASDDERNKMFIMVEKARLPGAKEGPAGYALYNEEFLMLMDPHEAPLGSGD